VSCSELQMRRAISASMRKSATRYVMCCNVLQFVVVRYSVLQCVVVCCSVL